MCRQDKTERCHERERERESEALIDYCSSLYRRLSMHDEHIIQLAAACARLMPNWHRPTSVAANYWLLLGCSTACWLITDRVSTAGKAIASVRPSVSTLSNCWTEWPLTLTFCVCMGHDHNFPGTEGQGQRSRSTRSVRPRSYVEDTVFYFDLSAAACKPLRGCWTICFLLMNVLYPTRHKIDHFGDVLVDQCAG